MPLYEKKFSSIDSEEQYQNLNEQKLLCNWKTLSLLKTSIFTLKFVIEYLRSFIILIKRPLCRLRTRTQSQILAYRARS